MQEVEATDNVIVEIDCRVAHRFRDKDVACKVQHRFDRQLGERAFERRGVDEVRLAKKRALRDRVAVPAGQVVVNAYFPALTDKARQP